VKPGRGPARPWPVHSAEARFIGEHDVQAPTTLRQLAWLSSQHVESRFFKRVLRRDLALGMKWTPHQFAPAMPG
jgi:hypothetical protein